MFSSSVPLSLTLDIHSHLIPNVDDGVSSLNEAIFILQKLKNLGYKKIVTTPHLSQTFYPQNTPSFLQERFQIVKKELEAKQIEMDFFLAAEYYIENQLLTTLQNNEPLLTWNNFILVELSFHNYPFIFEEIIFEIQKKNLTPILAHPERYHYLDIKKMQEWVNKGIKLQISPCSLAGMYGKSVQSKVKKLIKMGMAQILGSDIHNERYLEYHVKGLKNSLLAKKNPSEFLNEIL